VIEGLVMAHQYTDPIAFKLWRQSRRVPKKVGRPRRRQSVTNDTAVQRSP
jgi:hypothetical protein